jgi:cell division septation protein DedD
MLDEFDKESSYQLELGSGSLFGLFCAVAVICALFFVLGYTLGRHAVPATFSIADATAGSDAGVSKPNPSTPLAPANVDGAQPPSTSDLSAVESGRTPPTITSGATAQSAASTSSTAADAAAANGGTGASLQTTSADQEAFPGPPASASGEYVVQVFAGNKEDDAVSLAAALKSRQYPVFVKRPTPTQLDQLFRVQIGPYATMHEADEIRSRLASDGYNAIIKKSD